MIEVIDGDAKGRKWATGPKAKSFFVGRSEECQIKMPTAGSSISGKHLEFQKHIDGGWTVMDNSTFGTLVCGDWPLRKGKKVSQDAPSPPPTARARALPPPPDLTRTSTSNANGSA